MAAVQFFGQTAIIKAYTARGGTWGLFQGKELIAVGGDATQLGMFLTDMYQGSTAEYKLKFYPEMEPDDIDPATPHNGCYTFKLCEPGGYQPGQVARVGYAADPIMAGIQDYLHKKVAKVVERELKGEDDEGEGQADTFGDIVMGYLKDPVKLNSVIETVGRVFGRSVGMPVSLAAVGGVQPAAQRVAGSVKPATEAELLQKFNRVEAAFDRLEKCDPDFLVTFEKLATLAETNPAMYAMAKKML